MRAHKGFTMLRFIYYRGNIKSKGGWKKMEEEIGLLEVLERRQQSRKLREKRDAFIKRVRGEIKLSPLIKRIRGKGK
jgi:hypothetical protein